MGTGDWPTGAGAGEHGAGAPHRESPRAHPPHRRARRVPAPQELKANEDRDYGEDGAFRPLHGKCFSVPSAQYTYELCPFDKVTQKEGTRVVARLGSWVDDSWEEGNARMVYKNGDRCWNGPARSTTVTLECGLEPAVHTVSEPEMCKYAMTFTTAAACGHHHLQDVERSISRLTGGAPKDEL